MVFFFVFCIGFVSVGNYMTSRERREGIRLRDDNDASTLAIQRLRNEIGDLEQRSTFKASSSPTVILLRSSPHEAFMDYELTSITSIDIDCSTSRRPCVQYSFLPQKTMHRQS